MEDVRELVGHEQLDRIVGEEQVVLDRRVRERDDPVRWHGRRDAVEDVSLVDDDQPDPAARRRSIRACEQRMRRLGPRRRAPRVVLQSVLEGHDEVRGLEGPVSRERNLGSRVGGNQAARRTRGPRLVRRTFDQPFGQGLSTYSGALRFCPLKQQLPSRFGRYGLLKLLSPAGSAPTCARPLIRASTRSRAASA